ncbi:MAG TPA: hypothetical protein VF266_15515 [Thermoanaerobaculia bacterium]
MSKKFGIVSLLAVLALSIVLNVSVATDAHALAAESDTPCTDRYEGCIAGGGSQDFCDGMWCGCMHSRYGYVCDGTEV